jgi:hypothetical protein
MGRIGSCYLPRGLISEREFAQKGQADIFSLARLRPPESLRAEPDEDLNERETFKPYS